MREVSRQPPSVVDSTEGEEMDEARQVELFTDTVGGRLSRAVWPAATATLLELHHRPGAGVSGLYELSDGTSVRYLVATSEDLPAGSGTPLPGDDVDLVWWEHPADPKLPGLATASVPETVERIWGRGSPLEHLETVTYRPLRRAVLRARLGGETLYLKVLRRDADQLAARHRLLLEAGVPAPPVVGPVTDEVVALATVPGSPLAQALRDSPTLPLPAAAILNLVDAFPVDLLEMSSRHAWTDRIDAYADAAAVAVPAAAARIAATVARIHAVTGAVERGPLAPTHGDLYEANLFVEAGRISGVIDVDGAGPGYLVDDLACFVAHVSVLPTIDEGYAHTAAFADAYLRAFGDELEERGISRAGLLARTAAVVLTLVAGARDETLADWEATALARIRLAEGYAAQAWGLLRVTRPFGE